MVFGGCRWEAFTNYPVKARFPEGSILGLTLSLLYNDNFPDGIIYNTAIYADDALSVIRHLICDSSYSWLLRLNLMYKTM